MLPIVQNAPMTQIQADGFSVEVFRSQRRKTMALQVREGKVCLRMPARLALRHGEQFVHEQRDWLQAKLQQHPAPLQRHYRDGEPLLYMGRTLALRLWH